MNKIENSSNCFINELSQRNCKKLHLKRLDINSYLYEIHLKLTWQQIGTLEEKLQMQYLYPRFMVIVIKFQFDYDRCKLLSMILNVYINL